MDPRNPDLSGRTTQDVRRSTRRVHGSTAELQTPELAEDQSAHFPVHLPSLTHSPYTESVDAFLAKATSLLGVEPLLLVEYGRPRQRARLRTTVVLAWRMLGRRNNELCAALQVSQPAASNIIARATRDQRREAETLVRQLL